PSDATIETFLVRDRGFSEAGASDLIAEYKATLEFAKLDQPGIIPTEKSPAKKTDPMTDVFSGLFQRRSPTPPAPEEAADKVKVMEGERVAFTEEGRPGQYLKLIAS